MLMHYLIIKTEDNFDDAKDALFNGKDNWEYLYNIMASKHDYLGFYNEEIAYYFLWLTSLVKWLIIPAILGIIVNYSNKIMINPDGTHNHTI